jgi:hypothetical protein
MTRRRIVFSLAVLLSSTMALPVAAQHAPWWVRASAGLGPGSTNADYYLDVALTREIALGRRIGPGRAVELSYIDAESTGDHVCVTSIPAPPCLREFRASGWRLTMTQTGQLTRRVLGWTADLGVGVLRAQKGGDQRQGAVAVPASDQGEFHLGVALASPVGYRAAVTLSASAVALPFLSGGNIMLFPIELSLRFW